MEKIGITSTVPIEAIYAAGKSVVDLNNIFTGDEACFRFIDEAEKDGFPRTTCSWIKGVYAAAVRNGICRVVAVMQGDCTNTLAMAEAMKLQGIEIVPFSYPFNRDTGDLKYEIDKFIRRMGTSWEEAENKREELNEIREKIADIDRRTWEENTVSGFENHYYLVSASDFKGDPNAYRQEVEQFLEVVKKRSPFPQKIRVGYIGVPSLFLDLYEVIEELGARVVFNEVQRQFAMILPSSNLVEQYQRYTYPYSILFRIADIKREIKRREISCLIHYVQSFCFHKLEDGIIRREIDIPVLTLESDRPAKIDSRTRERLQNFFNLVAAKTKKPKSRSRAVLTLGMDLGSREVKVIFADGDNFVEMKSFDTMKFYKQYARKSDDGLIVDVEAMAKDWVLDFQQLRTERLRIGATGYGKNNIKVQGARILSEPLAHTYGAVYQTGLTDFTLLDIGGQDVKVVLVRGGHMVGFIMNDKCAAGSGRYLENMAKVLDVSLEELSKHYKNPVELNATCATFGESEIIGKIIAGYSMEELCAGVNWSVFRRILPILVRFKSAKLVISGGVAENQALRKLFEEHTDFDEVCLPRFPKFNGAIGCVVRMWDGEDY